MIIDAIKNGIVIDHIAAGKCMDLYQICLLYTSPSPRDS